MTGTISFELRVGDGNPSGNRLGRIAGEGTRYVGTYTTYAEARDAAVPEHPNEWLWLVGSERWFHGGGREDGQWFEIIPHIDGTLCHGCFVPAYCCGCGRSRPEVYTVSKDVCERLRLVHAEGCACGCREGYGL